jgi:hypothetical protein
LPEFSLITLKKSGVHEFSICVYDDVRTFFMDTRRRVDYAAMSTFAMTQLGIPFKVKNFVTIWHCRLTFTVIVNFCRFYLGMRLGRVHSSNTTKFSDY